MLQTNSSSGEWTLYFYDIFGKRITNVPSTDTPVNVAYFGSKPLEDWRRNGYRVANVSDRLGSVRVNSNNETFSYLPYGEEQTSTPDNRVKFATYFRDSPSQDYADQRYYNPGFGRFNTADPYRGSMDLGNPGSLNRYAYVNGDPVNNNDPSGLCLINGEEYPDPCFQVSSSPGSYGGSGGSGPEGPSLEAPPDPGFWGGSSGQRVYTGRTDAASNDPANAISPLIVQAMTLVGVNAALAALNNNPDCAGLFESESYTPNPATVLADIWNGTAYGSFAYGYIPDNLNPAGAITAWTNARTDGNGYVGQGPGGGLPQFTSATITMNTNAGTPNNSSGTAQDWAVTVLHELGHVYQMLFGQSSTQIRYDGDGSPAGTSAANTSLVSRNCLK